MKPLTLFAGCSLAAALLAPAHAEMLASQAKVAAPAGILSSQAKGHAPAGIGPIAPPTSLSGSGHGVLVTPGLEAGYLVAALQDLDGTRQYTMVAEAVAAIPLVPTQGYGFGVLHGSLVAPGVQLPMHGHYVLQLDGSGELVAQVFEPQARPGAPFAALGWIEGTIQAAVPEEPSLADVPVRPIVDPLFGGIQAEVALRWSLGR